MSAADGEARTSVLFICLGNICRSPLAEGVFAHLARARGREDRFVVDSAGTGAWHEGELADPRMRETARRHGVELTSRARRVTSEDFERFDLLICMDESNLRDLQLEGAPGERLSLLLAHDPAAPRRDVPDPYYGSGDGFETVYQLVHSACAALLAELAP